MRHIARQLLTRRATSALVLVLMGIAGIGGIWYALAARRGPQHPSGEVASAAPPVELDAAAIARIETFCGDCHHVPNPGGFPRDAWYAEVRAGYEFYAMSGRTDLKPPTIHETLAYYLARAPEQLTFPDPPEAPHKLNVSFRVEKRQFQENARVAPAISHFKWLQLWPNTKPVMVVTDMRSGTILALPLDDLTAQPQVLARLDNPCHVEPCDLDADGTPDLVVADLGSFGANDHDRGRVVWLRGFAGSRNYEPVVIARGLGRVADVRPGDLDHDGDLDLVVAVFGAFRTGDLRVLWNGTEPGQPPQFRHEIVDPRPGPIHVPLIDLNGDGYLDFVSVISQNYEQVTVFMNQLGMYSRVAPFHMQTLWAGPDLTFGSSGIELSDLDGDGDVDIIYTNGDAFDNSFVNPSHGVQWLENRGNLEFAYHRLTDLTGAYAARAGDLDLDGDQDIVAVVWLPGNVKPKNVLDRPLASIVCLEQTAPGQFVRHTLERQVLTHAALELADFDADGDLDFVVGSHAMGGGGGSGSGGGRGALPYWMAVWWNETK